MNFYINNYCDRIERKDKIIFRFIDDQIEEVFINKIFLSFYTSFFKNSLFSDDTFYLPFETLIAIKCLNHVHKLFINLKDDDKLFCLLKGFDYFCIDVEDIYKNIIHSFNFKNLFQLNNYTKDLLNYQTDLSLSILNELYDYYYINHNFSMIYTIDKEILLFILKRKWLVQLKYNDIIKNSFILEYHLFQSILGFMNTVNDIEKESTFKELWGYVNPYFLSKENLLQITNLPLSKYIHDDLINCIYEKFEMFSKRETLKKTRFRIKNDHVKEFNIGDRLQTLDFTKHWYNSTIIDMTEHTVIIHFDNFNEKYDEVIYKKCINRFLPLSTLEQNNSCPCSICIST
jgi:hypothetical protein